jgi:hypothetical protein
MNEITRKIFGKSDRELENIAEASGLSLRRMHEITSAYYHFGKPKGLSYMNYVRMYRHYNPFYGIYAPEIADRVFSSFSRKRNGFLDFDEFLSSILFADDQIRHQLIPITPPPSPLAIRPQAPVPTYREEMNCLPPCQPMRQEINVYPSQPELLREEIIPMSSQLNQMIRPNMRAFQPQILQPAMRQEINVYPSQPEVLREEIIPMSSQPQPMIMHNIRAYQQQPSQVMREEIIPFQPGTQNFEENPLPPIRYQKQPQMGKEEEYVLPARQIQRNFREKQCFEDYNYSKIFEIPADQAPHPIRIVVNIEPVSC